MKFVRNLLLGLLLIGAVTQLARADDDTMVLQLKDGNVVIQLEPNLAPKTVAHIKELVQKGFYDNTPIHRVIPGFMAQMGDPTGTGTGGSGRTVPAEFTNTPFQRGTVGLARSESEDSGDSQFFICFAPADFLNGQYTVFGQVTSGMEVVDKIKAGTEENNGAVDNPDHIIKATLGQ
jgi:peptidylprolyl isomerase